MMFLHLLYSFFFSSSKPATAASVRATEPRPAPLNPEYEDGNMYKQIHHHYYVYAGQAYQLQSKQSFSQFYLCREQCHLTGLIPTYCEHLWNFEKL